MKKKKRVLGFIMTFVIEISIIGYLFYGLHTRVKVLENKAIEIVYNPPTLCL